MQRCLFIDISTFVRLGGVSILFSYSPLTSCVANLHGNGKKMLNYCDFTPRARKEGSEKGACDAFLGGYTRGGFRKVYLSFLAFFYVPFFYFTNIFNFPV